MSHAAAESRQLSDDHLIVLTDQAQQLVEPLSMCRGTTDSLLNDDAGRLYSRSDECIHLACERLTVGGDASEAEQHVLSMRGAQNGTVTADAQKGTHSERDTPRKAVWAGCAQNRSIVKRPHRRPSERRSAAVYAVVVARPGKTIAPGETAGEPFLLSEKDSRGRVVVAVWVTRPDGSRYQIKRARARYREAMDAVQEAIEPPTHGPVTVDEVFESWLQQAEAHDRPRESTRLDYAATHRLHLSPAFGDVRLRDVTRARIIAWLDEKATEVRPKSSKHGRQTTGVRRKSLVDAWKTVIRHGLDLGVIDRNILEGGVNLPKRVTNPRPLSMEELAELSDAFDAVEARAGAVDPRLLYDSHIVMRETGLRVGEMLALRVEAWDPENVLLTVEATMRKGRSSTGGTTYVRGDVPKSDAGYRRVEPGDAAVEVLNRRTLGREGAAPLFPSRAGTHINPPQYARRWVTALRRRAEAMGVAFDEYILGGAGAGKEAVTPHDLRHTAASTVVRHHVDRLGVAAGLEEAAALLGHASTRTLVHYVPRELREVRASRALSTNDPVAARARQQMLELAATVHAEAEALGIGVWSGGQRPVWYVSDDAAAVMLRGVVPADAAVLGPADEGWTVEDAAF